MSDQPPSSPPPSDPAATPPAPASPSPKDKPGKWRRRFTRLFFLAILLAVLARVVVAIAFPIVLHRVAGYYNLDCSYDRLELSMLSGDAGLWHLTFTPRGGTEPIFNSEYVRGDISVLNLLRGRLAVWRVEADGVNILVDRNADGSIPLLKLLPTSQTTAASPTTSTATPQPINLSAPLRIDALRLTHIRARIHDQSVSPPLDATFTLNLRLSNLGWTTTPVHFAVDLDADPILDAMHVEGDGHADGTSLDASMQAKVDGLRLHPLEAYLRAIGVAPTANEISLEAGAFLHLQQSKGNPSILAGLLKLNDLGAIADGEEAAGLDHFTLTADAINLKTIKLGDLTIDNARINGRRWADGRVRFAGVEFVGVPPSTQPTAPSNSTFNLPAISLASLNLQHLHAGFHDDAIAPPVAVAIDVNNVSLKNVIFDRAQRDAALQLSGQALAPGIFGSAAFSGTAKPFATTKTLDLTLRASGIDPAALKSYLDALGIESRLHDASFACDLSADVSLPPGSIAADAHLKGIKLTDGSTNLLALDQVDLTGASYRIEHPLVHFKDVEIAGPVLSIAHNADGTLQAVGFATKAKSASPSDHLPAPQRPVPGTSGSASSGSHNSATTRPVPLALPALQIDHFAWKGIDIRYADQSLDPPAATELTDAGVEMSDILVDLNSTASNSSVPTGTLRAWAKIPKVIDSFTVDGTVSPAPAALACDLKIAGTGLTGAIVAPYLKSIGIEPTFHDGHFGAQVRLGASKKGVSLDAEQIKLSDGPQELAGVDILKIGDTSYANSQLNIGAIEIKRPRIGITHNADGAFALLGIHLSPDLFTRPAGSPVPVAPAIKKKPTTAPAFAVPFDVSLASLNVTQATLDWTDHAAKPQVHTAATADLKVGPLNLGKSIAPAPFFATAHVDGSIDSVHAEGTITPSLDAPAIDLTAGASGIRAGPLAAYLPPGITVPLRGAEFATSFAAQAKSNSLGGFSSDVTVHDLDYHDRGAKESLLKVGSFKIAASRIDPANNIFAIDEISSVGIETAAHRTADGGLALLGIELTTPPAPTTREAAPKHAAAEPPPTSNVAPADVAALVAQAKKAGAHITLTKLDLNLKRLALSDDMRPAAAPLIVSDLRFRNMAPVDWGGTGAENQPPTPFRMDCTLDPLVGAVTLTAQIAPLATMPSASLDLTAADIRGNGLTDLVPELKPYVDGSSLQSGIFHAHVDTQLRVERHGQWNIDLSRGFSADLDVKDIAFRDTPSSPVLLGLENIHSNAIRITPATASVHIKTLEITNPTGRVIRQADGIHLAGLVLKLPKTATEKAIETASTQPTTQSTTESSEELASTQPTTQELAETTTAPAPLATQASPSTSLQKPTGEIRVDQLLISGLNFDAEDQTMTPPLIVPLNSLDVEVRDFTTMAPYEDRPIRFNALVNAAKVPIPNKTGDTSPEQHRELFAQASANGQLSLYPIPHGWIKTSVSGLELAALGGPAHEAGVTLTGGVFDCTADARLPGDGKIHTTSHFVFTDLSLSEPPQGPIYRLLHLPAPLDVVIGALQDQEGSITVPIDVPVPVQVNKVSTGELVGPAVGAFGSIVATAIASAPLKAVGGVGDLLGLGGNKKHAPEPPITLPFEAGYTALSPGDQVEIQAIALRMKKDKSLNLVIRHDLGGGDLTVANERANPSARDALNLAEQLRQQQLNALQERSTLAGVARSQLAWGPGDAANSTIAQLRLIDQQVAANDDALDRTLSLLRPGADRQAARRTRGACLEYGRERLDNIKQALQSAGLTDLDRVHFATPKFEQVPGDDGGKVVVTLVPKKKD